MEESLSGYSKTFRAEILRSGLQGYDKMVDADKQGTRPMFRPKEWRKSSRWLEKRKKKKGWHGPFWKSCIFVPSTPGSELKKRMQEKEEETRVGGREGWPIKIIETAGRTLEQTLVNTDRGNKCSDPKCLPSKDPKNKINCRRNTVCYRVTCFLCLGAGHQANHDVYDDAGCYFGQSGKNAHCRIKEHVSKFSSKTAKVKEESAFFKHLENSHGGKAENKSFADYFEVRILKETVHNVCRGGHLHLDKASRLVFILIYWYTGTMGRQCYLLTSPTTGESFSTATVCGLWHQAKLIRTTTRVVQGGADSLLQQRAGGRVGGVGQGIGDQPREQGRARGQ